MLTDAAINALKPKNKLSIGEQTGPLIGVQKGPPESSALLFAPQP